MGLLRYKGYTGSVEYSEEDKCLYGKVLGIRGNLISYEGETIDEITTDFHEAVDSYLESCKDRVVEPAKAYSGKLVLRMSSELHSQVAQAAQSIGTTINEFITRTLSQEIAQAHK